MRSGLAALALDAYPEAYSEFKRAMLAFVYEEVNPRSPVSDLWEPAQRDHMADVLCSTLKEATGELCTASSFRHRNCKGVHS